MFFFVAALDIHVYLHECVFVIAANFTVPDVGCLFDEVDFAELDRNEAETLVETYREEGQKALPPPPPSPEKRFKPESDDKGRSMKLYMLHLA